MSALLPVAAAVSPTFQATIPDVLKDEEEYTRALSFYPLAGSLGAWIGLPKTLAVLACRMWPADDPQQIEHVHPAEDPPYAYGYAPHLDTTTRPVRHRHKSHSSQP